MPNRKQIRVSPDNGWRKVHREWSVRSSARTDTKREAIDTAQHIARREWLETKIQNRDGRISWGNSYGKDPYPPRDRR